jgi:hypothetical protein
MKKKSLIIILLFVLKNDLYSQYNFNSIATTICRCNPEAVIGNNNKILYYNKEENEDWQDYQKRIVLNIVERIDNNWIKTNTINISTEYDFYSVHNNEFKYINIGNQDYYYSIIDCGLMGTAYNGLNTFQFIFYNLSNSSIINLKYVRLAGEPNGTYSIDSVTNLSSYKEFISSTTSFIENRFGKDNLDIDNEKNYATKWNLSNENVFKELKRLKNTGEYIDLNILEYNPSFYKKMFENDFNSPVEYSNYQYLAYSSFVSPIFAYSKEFNKSYVVFIPEGYPTGGAWGLRSFYITNLIGNVIYAKSEEFRIEIDLVNKKIRSYDN